MAAAEHHPRSAFDDSDGDSDDDDEVNAYLVHDVVEQGAIERLRELLPPAPTAAAGGEAENDDAEIYPSIHVLAAETALLEKDDMGCLPLHIALIYQHTDCAMHLLQYSDALTSAMVRMKCADLNTPFAHLILRVGGLDAKFATDMIRAVYGPNDSAIAMRDADLRARLFDTLNVKDDEGNSVFHLCAMFNLDDALEILLAFYATMIQGENNNDAVPIASRPEVKAMLEKGNRLGLRPLHVAIKFDSLDVTRRLVNDLEVDVNSQTSLKQTPLHIAATYGIAAVVGLLLSAKTPADTSRVDLIGSTALAIATRSGFSTVARLLSDDRVESTVIEEPVRTHFFFHRDSLRHLPNAYHRRGGSEPPPENPERIDTLVDPVVGILRSREFQKSHISWDYEIDMADMADILRVHEYNYVAKIRESCERLGQPIKALSTSSKQEERENANEEDKDADEDEDSHRVFELDPDTALSRRSFEAASRAAGAVCRAVDKVISGDCANAFCIVRPPGHHAGPTGKVTCCNEPEGSHGFCVFNNVAIGAAYARSHYKHAGINRIAILDFDVHHGNGTEEIVRQLVPSTTELRYATPYGEGKQVVHQYKPWRNEQDPENVFFCSVHGYGHKDPQREFGRDVQAAWFYPGSGESVVKDAPLIMNVGMGFCPEGSSVSRLKWRSSFRDDVLPKLKAFEPDLIFLSAGFDAHKKENVNWGYVALLEQDYEWLVQHVKQVANACCQGRVISVLEGGYNFHGRMVSPFARSVAAHARALACPTREAWDDELIAKEAAHEHAILETYLHPAAADSIHNGSKKRANSSTASASASVATATATATATAAAEDEPPIAMAMGRSKRARKQVDYVALAAQLENQTQDATAAIQP